MVVLPTYLSDMDVCRYIHSVCVCMYVHTYKIQGSVKVNPTLLIRLDPFLIPADPPPLQEAASALPSSGSAWMERPSTWQDCGLIYCTVCIYCALPRTWLCVDYLTVTSRIILTGSSRPPGWYRRTHLDHFPLRGYHEGSLRTEVGT